MKSCYISIFLVLTLCLFQQVGGKEIAEASHSYSADGINYVHSAEAEFPSKLHFNLSAESAVNITDVRLYYTVEREDYAQVTSEVYVDFASDTAIDVQWTWDMRKTGGLPPGSIVEYWWTVEDIRNSKVSTTPVRVRFDDNRYSWRSLTEGKVTLYWYEGEQSFAEEIMLAAQQTLARLLEDTGAYPKKPVEVYIYADSQGLQGAMIFPQEWTGGVAFTRYGTIAIGIAPDSLAWGEKAIAHELAHLVIHQMTFNPYNDIPTWLSEGLAMYAEGTLSQGLVDYLKKTIAEESLISVRSLSSPFSAHAGQAYLAYAQSYSVVEFLVSNYGQGKMLGLLNTFSEGSSYDGALEKVYGFDMDGLDARWRDYAMRQYQESEVTTVVTLPARLNEEQGMPSVLVGALAGLTTALFLLLGLAAEHRAWRCGW
ncbi:peptidase MA family metallohydrolase [Chloroflexota bacterium]